MAKSLAARPWSVRPRSVLAPLLARVRGWSTAWPGEPAFVLLLVAVALLAHGLNMFHYPSFTSREDEGIYAEQAWAVLRLGQLSPYTYFYDHAPAGWLLIAAWMGLTGGPHAFGSAIDSGRVLMLLLHLAMVPLLYHLIRKLGGGPAAAGLGLLLFSVSPLAIYYQRLLLLDTLMLFWVLLSLDLLLNGWGQLSRIALSGVCFGLALLSKETAIFLLPALLFIAVQDRRDHQGRFAVGVWLVPMLIVASWYPLYALLKGELLPTGQAVQLSTNGYGASGVSLGDALLWQTTRDGGGALSWDNQFWQRVRTDWLPLDALLPVGGAAATLLNLLRGLRSRRALAAGLLGALPLAYLLRGGIVLDFYILFAIPFFCLNLALVLAVVLRRFSSGLAGLVGGLLALGLLGGYAQAATLLPLYTERPSWVGREAIAWVKANVPPASLIISGDNLWPDLHEPGLGGPGFPNVHSHWKVAADPAIKTGVFHDDWRTVDYLILSTDTRDSFTASNNTVALEALRNAHLVRVWSDQEAQVEIWKVDHPGATEQALLGESATFLRGHFEQDGAYLDRDGTVTSEAQSYALLRAVWSDDRVSFDRVWTWTRNHLLHDNGRLAWVWKDGRVVDPSTATDADTDIALALLLGGKRWGDQSLLTAGRQLVDAIWEREVVVLNGVPYVMAGDWADDGQIIALNPSYFAPYAYDIFRQVDPKHDWRGAIDSSYQVLFAASASPLGGARSAGLPPDWVGLDRASGELVPLRLDANDTTRYGFDAARTYWRIALDQRWRGDGRAATYLRLAGFLQDEVQRDGAPRAVYGRDGTPLESTTSVVSTAGALAALQTLNPPLAHPLFAEQLVAGVTHTGAEAHWADPTDLYAQSWGWFATALYADALPNLWSAP